MSRTRVFCENCGTKVTIEAVGLGDYGGVNIGAACDCAETTEGEHPEEWVEREVRTP